MSLFLKPINKSDSHLVRNPNITKLLMMHASPAFAGFQERVYASWESNQKVAASL